MMRRRFVIAVLLAAAFVAPAAAAADTGSQGGLVTAGGQRQWISCAGSGSPTMVISSGLGVPGQDVGSRRGGLKV